MRLKPEKQFQKDLEKVAALKGYLLIDIPDAPQSAELRYKNREKKRPFDCVLLTNYTLYCVELKYGYNKLMSHQYDLHLKMNEISDPYISAIVFRKKQLTKKVEYTKEWVHSSGKIINMLTTDKIEDLL